MSEMGGPFLRVSGLEGQRGDRPLFQNLHFTLHSGEVMWLRGRNGQGKTTLLRILAGLSTATSGDIQVCNGAVTDSDVAWRRQVGLYIAHANALKDDLSAIEALRFLAAIRGLAPNDATLHQALHHLGVSHRAKAPVRTLSQGQKRRVALARLYLDHQASLWLLDEPFDALDDAGIAVLNGLIQQHCERGGCCILTSHQSLSLSRPTARQFLIDDFAVVRR